MALTWCYEQQHKHQNREPNLPALPHGLQVANDGLIGHFGIGSVESFGFFVLVFAGFLNHAEFVDGTVVTERFT